MIATRYPHRAAGQVAAPIFVAAGFVAGFLTALWLNDAPNPFFNGIVWAAIEGLAAYLAFSGESRAQRPPTAGQAAAADGVVAGITGSVVASAFDLLVALGHAFKTGADLTATQAVIQIALAIFGAGLIGALLGLLVLRVGGDRLIRPRTQPRARKRRRR